MTNHSHGFDFNIGQVYHDGWRRGMFDALNDREFIASSKYNFFPEWERIYVDGYSDAFNQFKPSE